MLAARHDRRTCLDTLRKMKEIIIGTGLAGQFTAVYETREHETSLWRLVEIIMVMEKVFNRGV